MKWMYVWIAVCGITCSLAQAQSDEPTDAARRVAQEIRQEALLPPTGPQGRPMPLASHWNVGTVKGAFGPEHQIALIQDGHHILPWMAWPGGDPGSGQFKSYHERLLSYFAKLNLPISYRGTQWNAMLVSEKYRNVPDEQWAGVIAPNGDRKPLVSPFGAIEPWKDAANEYVNHAAMKRAQEIYPDPPLVLWVSNNEPPDLRWAKNGTLEEQSKRYVEKYGTNRSDEFKRKVVAEGWIERYRIMFDAMREALVNETWKKNVRFIGYDAFGPSHFGGSKNWKVYSLITDEWTDPHWYYWEGGSPSYYTSNWNDKRDHWVVSNQIELMNWIFMLEEAWKVNPNFWFEVSTWDGNELQPWMKGLGVEKPEELVKKSSQPLTPEECARIDEEDLKKAKVLQYMKDGQDYPPERAAGWVQFGMWLMRPRVLRQFYGSSTQLEPVKPYWMEVVRAVDRVYANETLKEFWRFGELVPNKARQHPYQTDIPEKYKTVDRWYLLDTNLDSERPWDRHTDIPVFSLALVRGSEGAKKWLLYAHSPLKDRKDVQINIPDFKWVTVDVPRSGAFYLVGEKPGRVEVVKTIF